MSWALDALGLAEDVDERAIKRAYAARLKVTRPDEDPQGFQQLHEAYQAALAWRRARTSRRDAAASLHGDDDVSSSPIAIEWVIDPPTPKTAPAIPAGDDMAARPEARPTPVHVDVTAPPARVDITATVHDILVQACTLTPAALASWLRAQPALWSLQHKPLIGHTLANRLFQSRPGMHEDNCELLVRCFDWDQVGSGVDALALGELRQRMHKHWLLEPAGEQTLHWHLIQRMRLASSTGQARSLVGQLQGAFSWSRLLGAALLPSKVAKVLQLLAAFGHPREPLPAQFNLRRVAFWSALDQAGQANLPRLLVGLARSALVGTAIGLLTLLLTLSSGRMDAVNLSLGLAIATVFAWLSWFGFAALIGWQSQDENVRSSRQAIFWRLAFIPLLVCLGMLLIHLGGQRILGSIVLIPGLILAVRRYMQRARLAFELKGWSLLLLLPIFKMGAVIFVFSEVAALGALVLWIMDTIKHRQTIARTWRAA
ncbi:hypothetical protein [Xanthomonas sp. WHRI 8932A]|uniref:hypothetical protein n=1 Tax=unclassified Xanthomonas TaxID=2643310 RepID=UPI002B231AF7|nr:hypothetical protein [Xanthomonas sp. WHRI 8932A]MEA9566756.1 hypothetical protein [Xanthomonas sp. WHRI 8932A]